uniref:Uncharacterized protein n=1 Tax=Triticum urartu TaxID=4572 RepID=A0A8R7TB71_TRIUA
MRCSSSLCISGSPPMCNSQRSSIQCSSFSSPRLASRPWPGRGSLWYASTSFGGSGSRWHGGRTHSQ